ncbi:MAG: nickel-binding protein, partial [Microcystaceae cyanobacterium]
KEACQKTGIVFKQVWQREMGTKTLSEKFDPKESAFLVESLYQKAITPEMLQSRQANNQYCFTVHNVQKRFTWLSSDGKRSICCFQANSAEDIRIALRQVQRPFNKLCKAYLFSNFRT